MAKADERARARVLIQHPRESACHCEEALQIRPTRQSRGATRLRRSRIDGIASQTIRLAMTPYITGSPHHVKSPPSPIARPRPRVTVSPCLLLAPSPCPRGRYYPPCARAEVVESPSALFIPFSLFKRKQLQNPLLLLLEGIDLAINSGVLDSLHDLTEKGSRFVPHLLEDLAVDLAVDEPQA